ncbi:MAG: hypothetical protein CMH54_12820 [Myxococcales bacterium]|nr:hypothetical protein [Myxococcales bacterium]
MGKINPDFDRCFRRGQQLISRGETLQALDAFAEAMEKIEPTESPNEYTVCAFQSAAAARKAGWHQEADQFLSMIARFESAPTRIRLRAASERVEQAMDWLAADVALNASLEAVALAGELDVPEIMAQQYGNMGLIEMRLGNYDAAHDNLLRSAALYGDLGDATNQARAWAALGSVAVKIDDFKAAEDYFSDAYEALLWLEDFEQAAIPRAQHGHLLRRQGDFHRAYSVLLEAESLMEEGSLRRIELNLDLAGVEMELGHWDQAWQRIGDVDGMTPGLRAKARYAQVDWYVGYGRLGDALEAVEESYALFASRSDKQGVLATSILRARILWAMGKAPEGLPDFQEIGELPNIRLVLELFSIERSLAKGELDVAVSLLRGVARLGKELRLGAHLQQVQTMAGLVVFLQGKRSAEELETHTADSAEILTSIGAYTTARNMLVRTALWLALYESYDAAERLLDIAAEIVAQVSQCPVPESTGQSVEQVERLIAIGRGLSTTDLVRKPSENFQIRSVDQAITAWSKNDEKSFAAVLHDLSNREHHFLATTLRSFFHSRWG